MLDQIPLFDDLPADPWIFDPLLPGQYDLIVCDPPWTWAPYSSKGLKKSAQRHYSCMDLAAIKALPVDRLAAPNCILMLWATTPMLPHALETMAAWSFNYRSQMIWRKTTATGKVRMGCGYWARSMHELILIGCRGKPRSLRPAFPSLFDGIAREHSRKPEEFYALLNSRSAVLRRADLFARTLRPGFDAWGDEVTKFMVGKNGPNQESPDLDQGSLSSCCPEISIPG